MADADSLKDFSTDEDSEVEMYTRPEEAEVEEDVAEEEPADGEDGKNKKKEKKPKAPKEDPPLLARPETPDDFERHEPQATELFVNCIDLPNADKKMLGASLSDPVCILYMKDEPSGKWFEAGRTEKIKDNLSPEWITRIPVDYFENEDSSCRFEVYDFNKNNTDLKKANFLGMFKCNFGDIIKGGELFGKECDMLAKDGESPNKKKGEASKIRIGALPVTNQKVLFTLQFGAKNIDKASKKGLTDAYLEMAASSNDGGDEYVTFHRTEVIKKTVDPEWAKFSITVNQISGDNSNRKLKITVNHWSKKGAKEIGTCSTSFQDLKDKVAAGEAIDFELINEQKKNDPKKGASYENSGIVSLLSMKKKKLRTKRVKKAAPVEEVEQAVATMDINPEDDPEPAENANEDDGQIFV